MPAHSDYNLPQDLAVVLSLIVQLLESHSSIIPTLNQSPNLKHEFLRAIDLSISSPIGDDPNDPTAPVAAATSGALDIDAYGTLPILEYDEWLPEEGNTSMTFDVSILGQTLTYHDFLLAPHISPPVSDLGRKYISARPPRAVEIVPPKEQLLQVIYLPSLGRLLHEFLRNINGENLEDLRLDYAMTRRLTAGPSIANSSEIMRTEADVEFHVRVTQADIVAEGINMINEIRKGKVPRIYPLKASPIRRAGQPSHAYPDMEIGKAVIEVKTNLSIDAFLTQNLFGSTVFALNAMIRGDAIGVIFDFHSPQSFDDTVGSTVQPLLQLFIQLREKTFCIGEGTSQEYSFFVVKDPEAPNRLIVSPVYSTFALGSKDEPLESGIYTMYNMFRIANEPDYSERFLKELRGAVNKEGALVPGVAREPGQMPPTANFSKGTVGVKSVPNRKQGVLRVPAVNAPRPVYKDESSVDDEPPFRPPPPLRPSKIPVFSMTEVPIQRNRSRSRSGARPVRLEEEPAVAGSSRDVRSRAQSRNHPPEEPSRRTRSLIAIESTHRSGLPQAKSKGTEG
ncbi:hypothetical protein B0H14DRAFT_3774403 [Mycena olivaceomarginata]|nr:hypothetical protein B0H14DRAFT_3774403 [Mycena olivaceomarginata]